MKTKSIVVSMMFVFLLHFCVIAQGVRIEPNTKITIESGTVIGIITGNLILESDAAGDVSLIVLGAVEINNNGKTNAERYLPGSVNAWHMMGTLVEGMAISGSDFDPGIETENDFYAWDEPFPGTWINYKNTTVSPTFNSVNNGDNFLPGKGYLVAYNSANTTKTTIGNLNVGNVTFNLKNSGVGKSWDYNVGWNLISNPYSSSIDWHEATRDLFQDNYAYIYDPNKSGGEGYILVDGDNAGAYIGSNQGFFVHVTLAANNQNFVFTDALQTHGGDSYLKSSSNIENTLVLRLSSQSYYDETTIVLSEECSYNRDRKDGLKLFSFNSSIPQLYCISQDEVNLAVNSMPNIAVEAPIPLGVRIPEAESYILSIQSNTIDFTSNTLYLEDKVLNKLHKIIGEDYQFTSPQGDINNRFVLHFGVTGINDNNKTDMLDIWVYNNKLFILSKTEQARLEIFDIQGRLMSSKTINFFGKYSEKLNLKPGVYVVRLQNRNMIQSKRIIIK